MSFMHLNGNIVIAYADLGAARITLMAKHFWDAVYLPVWTRTRMRENRQAYHQPHSYLVDCSLLLGMILS